MNALPANLNLPVSNPGLSGIQRASAGINKATAAIISNVNKSDGTDGLIRSMVELKRNQLLFEASGKVVKLSNDSAGRLIDLLA